MEETVPRPVQVFVSIAPDDQAEQDALYFHSAGTGSTPFPYEYPGVTWDARVPALRREFIAGQPREVGWQSQERRRWYTVRDRSAIVP